MQYYGYRFSIRDSFNPILHCGKLTQQYAVDSYIKIESNRLNYIKQNQLQLRKDTYQGISDYYESSKLNKIGVRHILPSTFIGSPRNQIQNYQDAMAIVNKFGQPDLLITFTCNPKWTEITDNLEPYEIASDRPDLIVRVFKNKFDDFYATIIKKHCFGKYII